jgi:excisionase family DNA binding protein
LTADGSAIKSIARVLCRVHGSAARAPWKNRDLGAVLVGISRHAARHPPPRVPLGGFSVWRKTVTNTQPKRAPAPRPAPLAYTVAAACAAASLSRTTLYEQVKAGRLKLVKVGRRSLIDAGSLHALLDIETK